MRTYLNSWLRESVHLCDQNAACRTVSFSAGIYANHRQFLELTTRNLPSKLINNFVGQRIFTTGYLLFTRKTTFACTQMTGSKSSVLPVRRQTITDSRDRVRSSSTNNWIPPVILTTISTIADMVTDATPSLTRLEVDNAHKLHCWRDTTNLRLANDILRCRTRRLLLRTTQESVVWGCDLHKYSPEGLG
jgi:hypothetical protein